MFDLKVIIIGGGIAGLAAALALKKNKYSWAPLLLDVIIGLIAFINHHHKYLFCNHV